MGEEDFELEQIDLSSILEQPTKVRSEVYELSDKKEQMEDLSNLVFEDEKETAENLIEQEQKQPEEPYDAEENAALLVGCIASVNDIVMTPLARWKVRHKFGGKKTLKTYQLQFAKSFTNKKLTDQEQKLADLYTAYLKDKEEMEKAIPYTDKEIENLTRAAIPYCKQSRIKVNGGVAFWVELGSLQMERIITVLSA